MHQLGKMQGHLSLVGKQLGNLARVKRTCVDANQEATTSYLTHGLVKLISFYLLLNHGYLTNLVDRSTLHI
jgi:hypothetical protein